MDVMVLKAQQWMNATYKNDSRYTPVTEDGLTGWETINGLIIALQIELNMAETAAVFGPTTRSLFNERFPNGILAQSNEDESTDNIYSIIQCALWCKGYYAETGTISGYFRGQSAASIVELKSDMGLADTSSTVNINIMDALLSMKQYVLILGGSSTIRNIQQELNASYENYVGLIPCDGYYGREMNIGLIKVLQAIEGYSPEEANGNFGENTKLKCPVVPWTVEPNIVKLLKYALCCNGYETEDLSGHWTEDTEAKVVAFQKEYGLDADGIAGLSTWMSLLLSCGNPERTALACDCATILNGDKANSLYDAGYRYVGRYLTGYVGGGVNAKSKAMTKDELNIVFDAGLRVFAIYQDNIPDVEYYTYKQGKNDAINAVNAAKNLGIPSGEIIYFAVDCDMMDYQITSNAIPYFRGIREEMKKADYLYNVGIYGSRNMCTRVSNNYLAKSSFVADMSTGYSGNAGYPIPKNWAFDQFNEYVFDGAFENFDLDKVAYSGRYSGFNELIDYDEYEPQEKYEDYKNCAERLFSIIGINVPLIFENNQPYVHIVCPGVEVRYSFDLEVALSNLPAEYASITIKDRNVVEGDATLLEGKYNGLDVELRGLISEDGTFGIASGFESEIKDGRIAFWYEGHSNGSVTAHFAIEENIYEGVQTNKKLCMYIDIYMYDTGTYDTVFNTIQQYQNMLSSDAVKALGWFVILSILSYGIIYVSLLNVISGVMTALAIAI